MDMEDMENIDVDELAMQTYATTDFEFVVALKALGDPIIKILMLLPYRYHGAKDRTKDTRVEMFLCGVDDKGNPRNAVREIEVLRLAYVNSELLVDPKRLFNESRALRPVVIDAGKKHRRKESMMHRTEKKDTRHGRADNSR